MADAALASTSKLRKEGLRLCAEDFQALLWRHASSGATGSASATDAALSTPAKAGTRPSSCSSCAQAWSDAAQPDECNSLRRR